MTMSSSPSNSPDSNDNSSNNDDLMTAAIHGTAGSLGAVMSMTLLYPLENIRTRMQVQNKVEIASRIQSRRASRVASRLTTPRAAEASARARVEHEKQLIEAVLRLKEAEREGPAVQELGDGLTQTRRDHDDDEHDDDDEIESCVGDDDDDDDDDDDEDLVIYTGPIHCARAVIRREGIGGLYRGMRSSLLGVAVSSSVYFFWYNLFKRVWHNRVGTGIGPIQNMVLASAAGAVNCFLTVPLWVVTTRLAVRSDRSTSSSLSSSSSSSSTRRDGAADGGLRSTFMNIYREEGLRGLYQGLIPALILVSNPSIQFMLYEQITKYLAWLRKYRLCGLYIRSAMNCRIYWTV